MVKKTNPAHAAKATSLMVAINALAQQRSDFEQNEYARSNARLYEILSGVYSSYLEAAADKTVLKATVKAMKEKLEVEGNRVQSNTLAIGVFVRYVFRSHRQRTFIYVNTLQAAIAANIAPAGLTQFITDKGGVEDCKKQFVKSAEAVAKQKSIDEAMPLVNEVLTNPVQTPLASFNVPAEFVAKTYDAEFTFLIAKADSNGHVQVISTVPAYSATMASWAKKELAVFLAEQQRRAEVESAGKLQEAAIDAAVRAAMQNNSATETVGELLGA